MICRACKKKLKNWNVIYKCRDDDGGSLIRESPWEIKYSNMKIWHCLMCGHRQAEYMLEPDLYEHYEDGQGALQYFSNLDNRDKYIAKLSKYSNFGEKILELGCGAGHDLINAKKYFKYSEGVDSSIDEIIISREKKLTVYHSYFDSKFSNVHKFSYDAIMSFQVLEHIEDVEDFLKNAYIVLKEGGVGLINVPNGQLIFERGLFHQIITQHINYWTPFSLSMALTNAGFDILEIENLDFALEINVYFKKRNREVDINEKKEILKENFDELYNYKRIGIWGAGAKSCSYLSMMEKNNIQCIFDTDDNKVGKYIAGFNKKIEKPDESVINSLDAVVIVATAYYKEILLLLRRQYGFNKDVFTISQEEKLIKV